MAIKKLSLPNLSYRKRKDGTPCCYWVAPITDKKFLPRTVNLSSLMKKPDELKERVEDLNAEYMHWKIGLKKAIEFGNVKSVIQAYEVDKESPFHELAPRSRRVYQHHLKWMKADIGKVSIDNITGKDLRRWYNQWSNDGKNKSNAKCRMSVLKAVINYGTQCRIRGCRDLYDVMKATSRYVSGGGGKREAYLTYDQVVALRKAAHEDGRPSLALAYALIFETTLRLFDVINELDWSHIDENLVLRYKPTKTERKTGLKVTYPLSVAPMVMEELKHHEIKASGPVIIMESRNRRYNEEYLPKIFRTHADKAGIPGHVVARDLRSSGITEARLYGADISDLAKIAGHSTPSTTSAVYDRAVFAAAERIASIRTENRVIPAENL